jgi:glycosyltransferase involved in cell wall biosynthesis
MKLSAAALEAMVCGCPVVTSNIGHMAEVTGEAHY